jgi:hypothetical protein
MQGDRWSIKLVMLDRVCIAYLKGAKPEEATTRHWCFKAKSRSGVDAFWHAGIAAGGADDGPPGLRHYHAAYYGAFLRDRARRTGSPAFAGDDSC